MKVAHLLSHLALAGSMIVGFSDSARWDYAFSVTVVAYLGVVLTQRS